VVSVQESWIGGTLDTIVGNVRRAPWLFRVVGLEWFYRLLKEPRRWRRQMALPRFARAVLRERLSGRKSEYRNPKFETPVKQKRRFHRAGKFKNFNDRNT
jgi:hypothetical protein